VKLKPEKKKIQALTGTFEPSPSTGILPTHNVTSSQTAL